MVAPKNESKIRNLRGFELKLELVCDQRDEFRIRRFSLGIGNRVSEEALEGIQVTSVPGDFDGMANSSLHPAGGGLEGLCHLGVEDFRDGIGVPYGPPGGLTDRVVWRGICE